MAKPKRSSIGASVTITQVAGMDHVVYSVTYNVPGIGPVLFEHGKSALTRGRWYVRAEGVHIGTVFSLEDAEEKVKSATAADLMLTWQEAAADAAADARDFRKKAAQKEADAARLRRLVTSATTEVADAAIARRATSLYNMEEEVLASC